MMETGRFNDQPLVNLYKEGDKYCSGTWERFDPTPRIAANAAAATTGHMGSDYYATHFFIEKILGRPDGIEWSIDVYQAVEMGICGILAHRSVLNGNIPIDVPNFRNPKERDAYRNDHFTTMPNAKEGYRLPITTMTNVRERDEQYYKYCEQLWKEGKKFENYPF